MLAIRSLISLLVSGHTAEEFSLNTVPTHSSLGALGCARGVFEMARKLIPGQLGVHDRTTSGLHHHSSRTVRSLRSNEKANASCHECYLLGFAPGRAPLHRLASVALPAHKVRAAEIPHAAMAKFLAVSSPTRYSCFSW
jgi:hypothetical protein